MCVLQSATGADQAGGAPELRGVVVLGTGHSIADLRKMLLSELQLCPSSGTWELRVVEPESGRMLADLSRAG